VEIDCAGGGRIDFGILKRTQRVWLSDSNDALELHINTTLPCSCPCRSRIASVRVAVTRQPHA
jgi:alpha-galactosidase